MSNTGNLFVNIRCTHERFDFSERHVKRVNAVRVSSRILQILTGALKKKWICHICLLIAALI